MNQNERITPDQAYVSWDIDTETLIDDEGNETSGDDYILIQNIWTAPELRGRGLARRLMKEALTEIAAQHPGLPVRLWCEAQDADTDIEMLAAFYESLGFSATGRDAEMELD